MNHTQSLESKTLSKKVKLLAWEHADSMEEPIKSITWFNGNVQDAAKIIRSRLKDIVNENPWILGRLVRDHESSSSLQLVFDEHNNESSDTDIDELFLFRTIHDVDTSYAFSLDMNFQMTLKLAQEYGFIVKFAQQRIDKDEPFFKVAIVQDSRDRNRFAIITSLCHRIGDGCTFYSLYKMLDPKRPIVSLCPERKLDVVKRVDERIGRMFDGRFRFWMGKRFAIDRLWCKIRGYKCSQKIFVLNDDYVNTVKNTQSTDRRLSTNDVIVSDCFKVSRPELGIMAINLRGRIGNCNFDDAPNYVRGIFYRPRDYATPVLIRESISGERLEGAAKPPTKLLTTSPTSLMNLQVSICTNWAAFNDDDFSLGLQFQQILHLPLKFDTKAPSLISSFIVFKPYPGKIAICVTGTAEMIEEFSKSALVQSTLDESNASSYFG